MITAAALVIALALGACATVDRPELTPARQALPTMPADIQRCFVGVVGVPKGKLTAGDVERLWKQDRVRSVAMERCGDRAVDWYASLRKKWR